MLLVLATVGVLGVLIYLRAEDVFFALVRDVAAVVVVVVLAATGVAYFLARRFTRSLAELREGARRLAEGDLDHTIRVVGSPEHAELAETLNAMSARLAATFRLLEHDREQLRAILSGMVEGVIAIDDRRRVLFANDRAGQLLEFDPRKAVNESLCNVTRLATFHAIVEKALALNLKPGEVG